MLGEECDTSAVSAYLIFAEQVNGLGPGIV
jgi:hypothetical protein